MARQHVDYTTSALSPPNAPVDDGLDTGSADPAAIRPVIDGQPAQAAVFKRPSENLRTRTEKIRAELENLKYLSDADRALLFTGPGSITWNGAGPGAFPLGTFQLTAATSLTIRPFLAPTTSIPSRLVICANTVAQVTFRTVRQAGTAPRAYSGANDITIDFQPVSVGTGAIVVTATGTPANNIHIQYDSHPTTYTTVDQTVGNGLVTQFNASAVALALGVEAVVEGLGTPPELGYPTPPLVSAAAKIDTYISAPEKATRFMSGAADAEKHVIPETQLTAFFSDPLNAMLEGDTLCIRYEDLVMSPTDGGRRQSISDLPENNLTIPSGSLFLLRRFPDRLPLALPIGAVADGKLVFINGRVYNSGESGPLVSSGASYQGSGPWADGTTIAAGSFESAVDTIVSSLGAYTGTTGAHKIGMQVLTGAGPSTFSTPAGPLDTVVANIIGELNVKPSLGIVNTFTKGNYITPSTANTHALTVNGTGFGNGLIANSGNTAAASAIEANTKAEGGTGLYGHGDAAVTNATGIYGEGKGTGRGVVGESLGNATGVYGTGGPNTGISAHGVYGETTNVGGWSDPQGPFGVVGVGGDTGTSGHGVVGLGAPESGGSGVVGVGSRSTAVPFPADLSGVYGLGGDGSIGPGVNGKGGSSSGPGVVGTGGAPDGHGVRGYGTGNGSGVIGEGAGNGVGGSFIGTGGSVPAFSKQGLVAAGGATGSPTGIFAEGGGPNGYGIHGRSKGTGVGVLGEGTTGNNSTGVIGRGYGAGSGGTFYSDAASGPGNAALNAIAQNTNGKGLWAVSTGASSAVFATAGTTGDGAEVYGGTAGGHGIYAEARGGSYDGVFGRGNGGAGGVHGVGQDTGIGTNTVDPRGLIGVGGKGKDQDGATHGGTGVYAVGATSGYFDNGSQVYHAGRGGNGTWSFGGSGYYGGSGVLGTGGTGSGFDDGIPNYGNSGPGGYFVGGAGDYTSLYGAGTGAYGEGGSNVGDAGGIGIHAKGGASDLGASFDGFSIYAERGPIKLGQGNVAYNFDTRPNTIMPQSVVKAWGVVNTTAASAAVSDGFNITSVTWDATNKVWVLNLINPITAGWSVGIINNHTSNLYFWTYAQSFHASEVFASTTITGAKVDFAGVGSSKFYFVIFGRQ